MENATHCFSRESPMFAEGAALPLVNIVREMLGLILDDSLNFVNTLRKLALKKVGKHLDVLRRPYRM